MLENKSTANAYFITLTYNDKNLYTINGESSLHKIELQNYFKTLRRELNFKYYAVGQYGGKTFRPHYHAAVFSKTPISFPEAFRLFQNKWYELSWAKSNLHKKEEDREPIRYRGTIHLLNLDQGLIKYIVRYIVERDSRFDYLCKMTGIEKEFSVMSRRPGIGVDYIRNKTTQQLKDMIDDYHIPEGKRYQLPGYFKALLKKKLPEEYNSKLYDLEQKRVEKLYSENLSNQIISKGNFEIYMKLLDERQLAHKINTKTLDSRRRD